MARRAGDVVSDRAQREKALDVRTSFLVQAPAGSGKTELLIQRYLALLADVELPEQVVAITFTRKAAAEMRHRVVAALRDAETGSQAEEGHRSTTIRLAKAVLSRSRDLDWSLAVQPQRLRIDTLDAMNLWLAQRLPLLAGGLAGSELSEDAVRCYRLAIRRTLEALEGRTTLAQSLARMLRSLDNNPMRLERMLSELLVRRDQWLPYLASGTGSELIEILEAALARLVDEALADAAARLPQGIVGLLGPLLGHAARHAVDAEARRRFAAWSQPAAENDGALPDAGAWRGAAEILLTRAHAWRKRPEPRQGFGAKHPEARKALQAVLVSLSGNEAARAALQDMRELPPREYTEAERRMLLALREILLHLTAQLKVVFGEQGVVDFVELALGAQQALGSMDEPSELLLALDRRIQHLLVDEFQDTSHSQLRLIRLLTAGWQRDDGRTVFLVGDPMQSIYRFRQADMSLFLRTKAHGIGQIRCESLVLEQNFRCAPAIVDWLNATFEAIFPAEDDLGAGAARFQACRAARETRARQAVSCHWLRDESPSAEADRVVTLLEAELGENSQCSIAVLVQSRSHLAGLHRRLRASGLAVHAVELEAPNRQQAVQDLIGLARALTHHADRVAWLGLLRAPWCGSTWEDLHALCKAGKGQPVWSLMHDTTALGRLSGEGRSRVLRIREILTEAFRARGRLPLEQWLERTWVRLGGPTCLEDIDELEAAERFFDALGGLTYNGDLDDPAVLEEYFSDPRGAGEAPEESGIEIMTVHRAKGLEFDTVILLGLARQPRADGAKGLYWYERIADNGSEDLLLAPLEPVSGPQQGIAAFIRNADAMRDQAERMRLLYVATTRARDRLHLVAQLPHGAERPPPASLLGCLWPLVAEQFPVPDASSPRTTKAQEFIVPKLRRLIASANPPREPFAAALASETELPRPEFLWAGFAAAQVGTVVHAMLHQIAASGPASWTAADIVARARRFRNELELLGVDEDQIEASTERVVEALCAVLADERGRWSLDEHAMASSELALTVDGPLGLEHLRIDRTFVDAQGTRWIIDFKTSLHEGGDVETFLDSEKQRYRRQMERYAAAMAEIDHRPLRVGLYFPLLQAFRDWSPGAAAD
jgi:ATP-dependent exoDNAse (exonuclease V) beta subunit